AGLQGGIQLIEGDDGGGGAQTLDQAVHDGVIGDAQLHAGQVGDAGHRLDGEEVAEALLAVEDAANGQAQLLGLVQEVGGEVGVGEVPPVLTADEGVGQAEQHRLLAAVAGKGESRETGQVDGVAAGEDVVQNVVFRAEHARSLQVDGDGPAGQLFDLLLKIGSGLADDGVQGVDLGIDQGDGGVAGGCSSVAGS